MRQPLPPSVKLGRSTHGRPISSQRLAGLVERVDRVAAAALPGRSSPSPALNCSRSSALSITSALAPIISTPYFSSTPCCARSIARLSPVCPPSVGSSASGRSLLDDLGDDLPGERLDVGAVGHLRIGHDRGRVRVDQHDLVAFFAQGLAGLRAGIIELAGLADDDRAGADEQNLVDVVASRHVAIPLNRGP